MSFPPKKDRFKSRPKRGNGPENDFSGEESESEDRPSMDEGERNSVPNGSKWKGGKRNGVINNDESPGSAGPNKHKTEGNSNGNEEVEEDDKDDKPNANDGKGKNIVKQKPKTGNNNEISKDGNGTKGLGKDKSKDTDSTTVSDSPEEITVQGFDRAQIKLSPAQRQLLKALRKSNDTAKNDEDSASEPSNAFKQGVKTAMEDVIYEVENHIQKTRGKDGGERTAMCIKDPETANKFTKALETVVINQEVNKALQETASQGINGTSGARVLVALGDLALVGVGSFVAIVSQGADSTAIASSISSQVVRDAKSVVGIGNKTFEEVALQSDDAKELMKLMGTNEAAVGESGTMTQGSLRTYEEFKSMVAFLRAEKQGSQTT
ncbi:hypothetical protein FGLOB1_3648 [Fusarium globosum]|uniref:Uncharacterized protein n=1 Tax=Fusarium globosum TaxID=78864 RepID=A0A8H6DDZ8_9HYPO|nr:hypothetical protein FGLOB1_3648 [Fusarium globosum]